MEDSMSLRMRYALGAAGIVALIALIITIAIGLPTSNETDTPPPTNTSGGGPTPDATQPPPLIFVTSAGAPQSGRDLRVLCYASHDASEPAADVMVTTNDAGRPRTPLPANCNYVAALHLEHEHPSGKADHGPAYRIYTTSWRPGTATPVPATGAVTIQDDRTLVLFDVVVSLAWEPAPDSTYVDELYEGLRRASAYLYDLTDGRMAFGDVSIHTGGRHWSGADIRVLASNDYRPSVYVGGIVPEPVVYSDGRYRPGAVFLGRYWDGQTASNREEGNWTQPGAYRTIIHEWAHYALFLYDEYQQAAGKQFYCPCAELPALEEDVTTVCDGITSDIAASAMAYQYTASELWHPADNAPAGCTTTEQWQVYGQTDWETLGRWEEIQGLPATVPALRVPETPAPGPEVGLTGHLFKHVPADTAPAGDSRKPTVQIQLDDATTQAALATQAYILEDAAAGAPARIVHQGTTLAATEPDAGMVGSLPLFGISSGDRARIFVDRYATADTPGGRFVYPGTAADDGELTDGRTLTATRAEWEASLDARYGIRGTAMTTMTVVLDSNGTALNQPPVAQLCAIEVTVGCHPDWKQTMTQTDTGTWTTTFTPLSGNGSLMRYGVVWVRAPGVGDLIRWFQAAGGVGPAHADADAPLRDGTFMVNSTDSLAGGEPCNRVIGMPAANDGALTASLGQDNDGRHIQGIVGLPYDMDVVLPQRGCAPDDSGEQPLPDEDSPIVLTLFYDQQTVDRLGIDEEQLRLLHYDRDAGTWTEVASGISGRSQELNWIAGAISEDGIYAIGWVGP